MRKYIVFFLVYFIIISSAKSEVHNLTEAILSMYCDFDKYHAKISDVISYFEKNHQIPNRNIFLKGICDYLESKITLDSIDYEKDKSFIEQYNNLKRKINDKSFYDFEIDTTTIKFTREICDFKPHYLSELAYKKGYQHLRLFFEDDYNSENFDCGYICFIGETNKHNLLLRVSNNQAYANDKFYEIDLSNLSDIVFKHINNKSDTEILNMLLNKRKYNNNAYQPLNEKIIEKLTSKFEFSHNLTSFSRYLEIKKFNLTIVANDAGLSIYNNKNKKLIKFFKNFYSGNDVE